MTCKCKQQKQKAFNFKRFDIVWHRSDPDRAMVVVQLLEDNDDDVEQGFPLYYCEWINKDGDIRHQYFREEVLQS